MGQRSFIWGGKCCSFGLDSVGSCELAAIDITHSNSLDLCVCHALLPGAPFLQVSCLAEPYRRGPVFLQGWEPVELAIVSHKATKAEWD